MRKCLPYVALFAAAAAGLSLASWNYLPQPSANFHFIDLAESFMAGRLDTDTPFRKKGSKVLPDDPPGLQAAVDRQMDSGGWNDWVSYFRVVLKSGDGYSGVWPWRLRGKGQKGYDLRERFVTLTGDWLEFDRNRDIRDVCLPVPGAGAQQLERVAWETRDRWRTERTACEDPEPEQLPDPTCPRGHRRTSCQSRSYFVSFPPFPAVLMAPFVALWHYNFNDVIFTILFAALNAALLFVLFRRMRELGYSVRGDRDLVLLALLFTFGTVNFFSAVRGEVWYTALIIGITLETLYLYFATDLRSPFLAGVALALGFATRTPLAFASAYIVLLILLQKVPYDRAGVLLRLRQVVLFGIPCVVVGIALMWFNSARFGNPFEFGHRFLLDGTRDSIVDHGMFSFWFLPRNLAAALTNVPQLIPEFPYVKITGHGISLLATTPILFYLLWPRKASVDAASAGRYRLSLHTTLWIAVACTAAPGLLYQNSGWFQFGYRFALDYMPMLFLLLAVDERRHSRLFYSLAAVGIIVNLFGAVTFGRANVFYY